MNAATELMPTLNGIPYFGSAKVIDCDPQKNAVNVKAQLMGSERRIQARLATQSPNPLSLDDEVLIAGSHLNEMYVIGIIAAGSGSTNTVIKTSSGAYAALSDSGSTEEKTIQVYSQRNELLFEYDPVKEHAVVNVRKGNLELRTEEGDIRLSSASTVRINAHCIEMNSNKLYATAGYARFVFDRLETMFDTLVEQAKNVYRTVTQLTQLRSGRMRTLVDETYQFKANKAFLKSEEDFKIKGEKIHLG